MRLCYELDLEATAVELIKDQVRSSELYFRPFLLHSNEEVQHSGTFLGANLLKMNGSHARLQGL